MSVEILRMRRGDLDQDHDGVGGVAFAAASSRHAHSTNFFGKPLCDGSPETLFILGVLPFRRLWATLWSRDQFRAFAWLLRHRHHSLHDACIRIRPHSNFTFCFISYPSSTFKHLKWKYKENSIHNLKMYTIW